jgi:hypothetical protein
MLDCAPRRLAADAPNLLDKDNARTTHAVAHPLENGGR